MEKVWQKKKLKCQQVEKYEAKNTGKPYLQDLNAATPNTTTDFHGRRRKFLYLTEDNNRAKGVTKIDNHDYVRGRWE